MTNNEGITDDIRKREEEYFRRRDRELIERMREQASAAHAREELETATGIHDADSLAELETLGFTPRTIALLPLVPVLRVAWAEAGISAAERSMIVDLARARNIEPGSEADVLLMEWLDSRPSEETFQKAGRLIAAMLKRPEGTELHVTADDLMKHCEQIAHASGGVFGFGSVSAKEKAAMQTIADQLRAR